MISIIVPVFNSEKYLEKCISSVLKQTVTDWELILVDDGSTDDSSKLCYKFSQKDSRIRVIHKMNAGVSSARNRGLDEAVGEYIMFIDADDWIDENLCGDLLTAMHQKDNCDLVVGGYTCMKLKEKKKISVDKPLFLSMENNFKDYFIKLYKKPLLNTPGSKLYRRSLVDKERFDTSVKMGEDLLFNFGYLSKCRQIAIVTTVGYMYNQMNNTSATKTFRESDLQDVILYCKEGIEFSKRCHLGDQTAVFQKQICQTLSGYLQKIFYSPFPLAEKKRLAQIFFQNKDFMSSCATQFSFPLRVNIARKLCLMKSFYGLYLFYAGKKAMTRLIRGTDTIDMYTVSCTQSQYHNNRGKI